MNRTISVLVLVTFSLFACEQEQEPEKATPNTANNDKSSDESSTNHNDLNTSTDGIIVDNNDNNNDNDNNSDDSNDTGEEVCQEIDFEIEVLPTRLMILQDMSASMATNDKWGQARSALEELLTQWQDQEGIEFGFDFFPISNDCQTNTVVTVDAEIGTIPKILTKLSEIEPAGSTPLCKAMLQFDPSDNANYAPNFKNSDASSYLLIVSDGEDSCGGTGRCKKVGGFLGLGGSPDIAQLTQDLFNQEVKTFVIGFGGDSSLTALNDIAQNGGTPFDTYIDAQNGVQLEQAFNEIASEAVSCIYEIPESEANVDRDTANFIFEGSGKPLSFSPDGCQATSNTMSWAWSDDTQTKIEFCGAACDMLKTNKVKGQFGCERPPVV